jgi:sugar phosphate isomerase/epimerase
MSMTARNGFAISTYALSDKPLQQAVEQLIDGGWKAIEIMCEGGHEELLDWSEERLAWLQRAGIENGIRWSIHAPITGCNPAAADAGERVASLRLLMLTMRIAEQLACSYIVLHPGEVEGDAQAGGNEEAAPRVAGFLLELLKATEGSQVVIGLENVPPYPGLLGTDAAFLERVVRLAGSRRVRIVFDVGHAHLTGEGQCLRALRQLLPEVAAVHLSDNYGEHDDHLALGKGGVPIEAAVALLQESGFNGAWVLEMRNVPDALASAQWLNNKLRRR